MQFHVLRCWAGDNTDLVAYIIRVTMIQKIALRLGQ